MKRNTFLSEKARPEAVSKEPAKQQTGRSRLQGEVRWSLGPLLQKRRAGPFWPPLSHQVLRRLLKAGPEAHHRTSAVLGACGWKPADIPEVGTHRLQQPGTGILAPGHPDPQGQWSGSQLPAAHLRANGGESPPAGHQMPTFLLPPISNSCHPPRMSPAAVRYPSQTEICSVS